MTVVEARSYSRNSGRDLVRGDDVGARVAPAKLRRDGLLVLRMAEREEEADGDRLGVELGERAEIEPLELAVGRHAPVDADAPVERDERRGMLRARPVEVRARLAAEVEQMLEAGSRHERRASASPLEQRVGGDRRPVREALDALAANGRGRREHRRLLVPRRRHLRGAHAAVLDEDGVRERAADVDAQEGAAGSHARHSRARLAPRPRSPRSEGARGLPHTLLDCDRQDISQGPERQTGPPYGPGTCAGRTVGLACLGACAGRLPTFVARLACLLRTPTQPASRARRVRATAWSQLRAPRRAQRRTAPFAWSSCSWSSSLPLLRLPVTS